MDVRGHTANLIKIRSAQEKPSDGDFLPPAYLPSCCATPALVSRPGTHHMVAWGSRSQSKPLPLVRVADSCSHRRQLQNDLTSLAATTHIAREPVNA